MFDFKQFRLDRLAVIALFSALIMLPGCGQQPDNSQATVEPTATPASVKPSTAPPAAATAQTSARGASTTSDPAPAASTSTEASPATAAAPTTGGAVITFAKELHDFGEIVDTETHRTTFPFTNTGDQRLVITRVKAACGCTTPVLTKKVFEPGEGHEIEITFDPKGKSGNTDKYITVFSNAVNGEEFKVKLTSNILPMLDYNRMHRVGNIPLSEGYQEIISVKYKDPDLQFKNLTVNNEWVTATVVEKAITESINDAGETIYRADIDLRVAPDVPWGLLYATRLTMSVFGSPREGTPSVDYDYTMYITGSIFGKIEAAPTIISLGTLKPGDSFEKFTELRRPDGEPFQIINVEVADTAAEGINVRVETIDPARHRVYVYGSAEFRGSAKGQIVVTTNVPGEEVLSLRFSGFARP